MKFVNTFGRMAGSAFVAAFCLASPLAAQDCSRDDLTQNEMNACAVQAWKYANEDLKLAYRIARDAARDMDQYLEEGDVPAVKMLKDAQITWISYRDKACDAESMLMRGGTAESMLKYTCMERLTRQRTEDLRYFGEAN